MEMHTLRLLDRSGPLDRDHARLLVQASCLLLQECPLGPRTRYLSGRGPWNKAWVCFALALELGRYYPEASIRTVKQGLILM